MVGCRRRGSGFSAAQPGRNPLPGLASHPEHAPTKAMLLDLADRAMYRGKESTRNVVYIAAAEKPVAR